MITASVAIGVFGAGAGLGAVIAARPDSGEGRVMRLVAGTYLLDDQAVAWTSTASPGGDRPLSLSGADAGSAISKGSAADTAENPRVCLTTTVDGHAVGAAGKGCVALPVLAAAAAAPLVQRPGDPRSTGAPPAKTAAPARSSAPKTSSAPRATSNAQAARRTAAPVQPDPAPAVRPPVVNDPPAKPAPTPTEKLSGNISQNQPKNQESGSVIEQPQQTVVVAPQPAPESSQGRSADPSRPAQPRPTGNVTGQPRTGGDRSSQPRPTGDPRTSQDRPRTGGERSSQPRTGNGDQTPRQQDGTPRSRPTGSLKPAIRSGPGGPLAPRSEATVPETRPTDDAATQQRRTRPTREASPAPLPAPPTATTPAEPGERPRAAEPSQDAPDAPSRPSAGPGENTSRGPDGTTLTPAAPRLPGGGPDGGVSLPIFKDPELLRRAQEALGLDRGMRYTDENGVWDLNIAPPGTPPCRDYTAEEIDELNRSKGSDPATGRQAIPRDSCVWPAFVRWLYAEPAPGEVSNWTKFTGLPQRNLELVVTDPPPVPLPRPIPEGDASSPDSPDSPEGSRQDVPGDSGTGQEDPGLPAPPRQESGRQESGQQEQGQRGRQGPPRSGSDDPADGRWGSGQDTGERDALLPDQGQVEPDPVEYDGR
ncbi:hypothetical protein ACLQ2R_04805 [Streptosporangium sp. DT93]|uniref:hypothetical protein n=1 Tax=Streptosporangium sp. DT93 TaxID=3393428 RepID=UPI003CF7E904